jgi:hypothetical protein
MRESAEREDLAYGEYAVAVAVAVRLRDMAEEETKGEPGREFTRRMSSDIGVDLARMADLVEEACSWAGVLAHSTIGRTFSCQASHALMIVIDRFRRYLDRHFMRHILVVYAIIQTKRLLDCLLFPFPAA